MFHSKKPQVFPFLDTHTHTQAQKHRHMLTHHSETTYRPQH